MWHSEHIPSPSSHLPAYRRSPAPTVARSVYPPAVNPLEFASEKIGMRLLRSHVVGSLVVLAACSEMPNAGPTTSQVLDQAGNQHSAPFTLVEFSPTVVAAAATEPGEGLHPRFRGKPPPPTIGLGDTVVITIWASRRAWPVRAAAWYRGVRGGEQQ